MQNDLISRSAMLKEAAADGAYGYVDAKQIAAAPAVDAVEVGSCDGCYWKEIGRQQKCSCCRRNRYLKDCYEAKMEEKHER